MSQYQPYMPSLIGSKLITYNLVKNEPGLSIRQISRFFGISRQAAQDRLYPLLDNHYIREKVDNKKGKKVYYIDKRKRIR